MDEKAFIQGTVEALEESVEFFSNPMKKERELWVCRKFLSTLQVPFNDTEVSAEVEEPGDVVYGTAAFQVKEISDPGRKRQDEFAAKLATARTAVRADELLTEFTPRDLTPAEASRLAHELVQKLDRKYAPADRRKTNLLLYVNLQHHFFKPGPLPELGALAAHDWRSICVLLNNGAIVLYAAPDAPRYIADNVGRIILPEGLS
jgi:hypothetical protein